MFVREMKKIANILFICFLFSVLCLPVRSFAMEKEGSLSIHYDVGKGKFSLYRVADFDETGEFDITEPFAPYNVEVEGLDTAGWRALASTLAGYVDRDSIEPMAMLETGEDGNVHYGGLQTGLYLVIGAPSQAEEAVYLTEPFLVTIPGRDATGAFDYEIEVQPKVEQQQGPVDRSVVKVWKDEGDETIRPKEVKIQLLRDGILYDTVILDEENSWEYTWKELPGGYVWRAVEQTVDDAYTVTSVLEGETFVVTNTYREGCPPKEPEKVLPQTGQLWWPVPIFASLGMVACMIGWVRKQKEE